jgi:hypothetical protein
MQVFATVLEQATGPARGVAAEVRVPIVAVPSCDSAALIAPKPISCETSSAAVYASALVAVMPGNLGVMDGIYLLGGHSLGLTAHESAAIALLLRAAHIVSCFLIALLVPSGQPGITGSRA